jgi:two-component system, OmpR family, phosphate regulon sensor histidine kinase PhoR
MTSMDDRSRQDEHFAALRRELADSQARAEAADVASATARDLLVLASEELRGPLTSVSGYLQVLLDGEVGDLTEGQERIAAIAVRNAERLERLVDDLIVVAQAHGNASTVRDRVDIVRLVHERTRESVRRASERGVSLECHCQDVTPIPADLAGLAQMIDYMLDSALTFSEADGTIRLSVLAGAESVVIEVNDAGMGWAPEDLPALFDGRAVRGSASVRAMLGSRLGLFLVRAVAEAHGGRVEAESDEATGNTVRAILPKGGHTAD